MPGTLGGKAPDSGPAGKRDEARRTRLGRGTDLSLLALALSLAVLAGALGLSLLGAEISPVALLAAAVLALAIAVFLLLHIRAMLQGHLQALERMRGAVVTLAASDSAVLPLLPEDADAEAARLHAALGELTARTAQERATPDGRLEAVLRSITDAIVVITDQGQVSLVNYPAKMLLGEETVRVGTSVFAALRRDPVVQAMALSERKGRIVAAELDRVTGERLAGWVSALGEHGGAVLSIPSDSAGAAEQGAGHRAGLEHDLALHDQPPAAPAVTRETPLSELPILVLDTETTGLDVTGDRIVSIGAVRLHGTRIYRSRSFDRLVNPGRPIPPRSTAVHGITDAMVADAEGFPAVYAALSELLEGTVMVGHNIPFDLAMLRRECELAGIDWQPPPFLDTLPIVVAHDPGLANFDLEGLAERFGVDIHGRHTALGDCLVTAEIYARLVPQLIERGVATLGAAEDHAATARGVIQKQKDSGW